MRSSAWVLAIIVASIIVLYITKFQFTYVDISRPAHVRTSSSTSRCLAGVCLPVRVFDVFKRQRLPTAVIIGTRKGGTAALREILASHPQIAEAVNEPHYFDDDRNFGLGINWYRSRMPLVSSNQIAIEKSPAYMFKANAPRRMHRLNPDAKIIAILRNPVDRLLSDYMQVQDSRMIKIQALLPPPGDVYIDRAHSLLKNITAVRVGLYVLQLERWLKYFPREQLRVVDGDLFLKDPLPALRSLESFFNISPYFSRDNVFYNATRGFHCWLADGAPKCTRKTKGRPKAKVNESDLALMTSYYQPYNKRLFELLGQTFDW